MLQTRKQTFGLQERTENSGETNERYSEHLSGVKNTTKQNKNTRKSQTEISFNNYVEFYIICMLLRIVLAKEIMFDISVKTSPER